MKTYKAAQGLMALGSLHAVVGAPHPESVPITSGANIYSMENTTAYSLHSAAEAELATSLRVPHDLPSHPHCTYKGPGSRMYMVFSKDFGRHDETSQDGCGNHMLLHLREECTDWIVNWSCIETPEGEHSAFMEFKVPIQVSSAGPKCVERAFRWASGPQRRQTVNCCPRGDLSCRKRNCEEYQKKNPGVKC